jgi:hypothetical protein
MMALALSVSVAWAGGGGFGGGGRGGRGGGGMGGGGFGGGGMGGGGFGGGGMGGGGRGGMGAGGMGGYYQQGNTTNLRTNRTLNTLQSALASPDDEWAVLAPKVQRVTDELTQVNLAGMNTVNSRMYTGATANAVATTLSDLNNALADPTQGDEVIRAKLSAYRNALQAAKSALTIAREDLRQYVTLRQEAILIGLGYLD